MVNLSVIKCIEWTQRKLMTCFEVRTCDVLMCNLRKKFS